MALWTEQGPPLVNPLAGATRYEYDRFSGSQISVMIGDVLIDDAVAIDFEVSQTKTPVYGYASQYFSFMAAGQVLVQGALVIGFKESGYLLWPIAHYANMIASGAWTSPRIGYGKDGQIVQGYDVIGSDMTFMTAAKAAAKRKIAQANVEQMVETTNNLSKTTAYRELGFLSDDKFEDWAEVFEDAIWYGSDPASAGMRDRLFSRNIDPNIAGLLDEEFVLSHRRADQYPPFDIWITYGDINTGPANHTVRKLLDVSFTGQSQRIEVSGEPIYEVYPFLARNLV